MFFKICLCLSLLFIVDGLHLASYITPCKKDDPDLNKCAKESAIKAIPYIIKGDKAFNTPPLNPLKLPLINVQASQDLNLKLNDCVLSGLENIVVEDIKIDLKTHRCSVVVSSKYINLVANYNIDGRILILPISGNGPMNITCLDNTFDYSLDFKLVDKDGKKYVEIVNPKISYKIGKSSYYFGNLFNGDQRLGDEMNKFLNENSKEVENDLSPTISETISTIVTSIIKSLTDNVPFEEIFP